MLVSSSAWKTFKRIYVRTYVQEILASLHHFYDCVTSISWYSFPGYITINNSNNMKYFCFFFQRRRQQRTEKERSKRRRQYWFHDSSQIFLKAELFFILFNTFHFFAYRNVCLPFYGFWWILDFIFFKSLSVQLLEVSSDP